MGIPIWPPSESGWDIVHEDPKVAIEAPLLGFLYYTLAEYAWKNDPFQWDEHELPFGFDAIEYLLMISLSAGGQLPSARVASMALSGYDVLLRTAYEADLPSSWLAPTLSFARPKAAEAELKIWVVHIQDGISSQNLTAKVEDLGMPPQPQYPRIKASLGWRGKAIDYRDIIALHDNTLKEVPYVFTPDTTLSTLLGLGDSIVKTTRNNAAYIQIDFLQDYGGTVTLDDLATSLRQVLLGYGNSKRYETLESWWTREGDLLPFIKIKIEVGPAPGPSNQNGIMKTPSGETVDSQGAIPVTSS